MRFNRFLHLTGAFAIVFSLMVTLLVGPPAASSQSGVAGSSARPADTTYALGENIRVTPTSSESVDVIGTPRLKIDMDSANRGEERANYGSGIGTPNLTFVHQVVEPNISTQGISVLANSLELSGGAIRSVIGTNALLSRSRPDHDAGQTVGWQLQNSPPTGAPTITGGPTAASFDERDTGIVATYTATDPENDGIAWSVEGTDAAEFNISAGGGLRFKTSPDFEAPSDVDSDNTYLVTVKATANGESDTRAVTITVNDVDEAPTITGGPTAPSFAERGTPGSKCCQKGRLCHPPARNLPEHGTGIVGIYTATDPENDSIVWSVEGTDAAQFNISAGGALSFKALPNFEAPSDADNNNTYLVKVRATTNGKSDTRLVTVTVTDGNDPPHFIQKNEAIMLEEGYAHYLFDFGASDPQRDTITFSLAGPDSEVFTYEHIFNTGTMCYAALNLLHYGREPDYEQPTDADKDGVFSVIVQVSDGALTTELPITVTVTDVDEAPVISGKAAVDYPEGSFADVGAYSAADPEGGTATLTLGGTDADSFSFSDGVLRFNSPPDYETKNSYSVTFTATDEADESGVTRSSSLGVAVTITRDKYAAPGRVTGLSASVSSDSVALSWSAPSGGGDVTGYRILRRAADSESSFQTVVSNTGNTGVSWTDNNVGSRTKYLYRVRALGDGGAGELSLPAEVITPKAPAPGRVTRLSASGSSDSVALSWSAPSAGGDVSGYRILRRAPDSEANFQTVVNDTGDTGTSWTDNNVGWRTKYIYRVRALGNGGDGELSLPAEAVTPKAPAPGRVTGLSASGTSDSVALSWSAPSAGGEVSGYRILRRAPDSESNFQTVVNDTGDTGTSWTDNSVRSGTKYIYRVRALGDGGEGELSHAAEAVTPKPPAPGRVTGLSASGASDSVALNWSAPSAGGEVSGYRILRRAPDSESSFQTVVNDIADTGTSWTDNNVSSGTKYIYRVRALGDGGEGTPSLPAQVLTSD